jgi:tetratricopeptide (TPR) repeat protein
MMGRDDWYRNTEWDIEIEQAFRAKISRARGMRPQYLRIQAGQIADKYPDVSLALIDEYFETHDEFDVPNAYCVRAQAYQALGRQQDALLAYKQALEWEASHPRHISTARHDLPRLVVDGRLASEYDYALEILTSRYTASDHQFPSTRYHWNGCCALITFELGQWEEAREFAERAMRAAAETESPFRYHRNVGVVRDTSDEFGRRIKRISQPSKVRSLFRLLGKR